MGSKFKPVFTGPDGTIDGCGDEEGEDGDDGGGGRRGRCRTGQGNRARRRSGGPVATELQAEFEGFKDQSSDAKSACPLPAVKKP